MYLVSIIAINSRCLVSCTINPCRLVEEHLLANKLPSTWLKYGICFTLSICMHVLHGDVLSLCFSVSFILRADMGGAVLLT